LWWYRCPADEDFQQREDENHRPLVDSWWNDNGPPTNRQWPPRHDHHEDHPGSRLERLAADSAVGRLALMIQRFAAANNQLDLPVTHAPPPTSSYLYQATPPGQQMTSSPGAVTSSGDRRAWYHCHVCSYVGKSLTVGVSTLDNHRQHFVFLRAKAATAFSAS